MARRMSRKQVRAMWAKRTSGRSKKSISALRAAPRGRAWHAERGINAYRNKEEAYEYKRGRSKLRKVLGF